MIKKLILSMLVLMLAISVSLASGPQGIHEPGTGLANPDTKDAAQGTGQGIMNVNGANSSASTPGIHEPGTGITNPELREAAQGTGQGNQAQAVQPGKGPETPTQETQPGFEVIFALTGFIAVSYILLGRRD